MTALKNKIDFVVIVAVNRANCNGDPLNGNRPRTDYNGFGEISDCASSASCATACRIWVTPSLCSPTTAATTALTA